MPTTRHFQAARAAYGAALLCAPGPLLRLASGHRADQRARAVTRLLGARQLTQAALVSARGTPTAVVLATAADLAHATSMVLLAALDGPRRRIALLDALAALTLAVTGPACTRTRATGASGTDDAESVQRRIRQFRDRLLAGRGPGASPRETARFMRDRPTLGAQSSPTAREDVAAEAAIARHNRRGA